MGERTVTGMSAARRGCAVLISGIVTAGVLGTPAVGGQLDSGVTAVSLATPSTSDVVRNHDFRDGRASWYPSPGASLAVRPSGSVKALVLSNTSRRTRSMIARSASSPVTFAAGTRVKVTAQLRTSIKAGQLALRVQEHAPTTAAPRWRTTPLYRSSLSYRTVTTTLTIGRDGSRVSVRALNLKAKGKQRLFVRSLQVSVVEPPAPVEEWVVNPGCSLGPEGWTRRPTPGSTRSRTRSRPARSRRAPRATPRRPPGRHRRGSRQRDRWCTWRARLSRAGPTDRSG